MQFVALDSLGVQRSVDVLTMLIVGGTGVLYGSFVGATVYMVVRDQLADLNPAYWYFWIGLILVMVVLFTRNGIVGALVRPRRLAAAQARRRAARHDRDGAGDARPQQEFRRAQGDAGCRRSRCRSARAMR